MAPSSICHYNTIFLMPKYARKAVVPLMQHNHNRGAQDVEKCPTFRYFPRETDEAGPNFEWTCSSSIKDNDLQSLTNLNSVQILASPTSAILTKRPHSPSAASDTARMTARRARYNDYYDRKNSALESDSQQAHVPLAVDFQDKISKLPPEICQIIMNMLFEEIFGPRMIHSRNESSMMKRFLALNKQLYRQYSHVYWSQNTWVVGEGHTNISMKFMTVPPFDNSITEFSRQRPNEAGLRIRRLELRFSPKDLEAPYLATIDRKKGPRLNGFWEQVEQCHMDAKTATSYLLQIWQDKFDRVAFLDLDRLTLDFRDAYAPDGVFLGVTLAQHLMRFVYRMPTEMVTMAPTKAYEEEIRTVLKELNKSGGKLVEIWTEDCL